MKQFLFEYRFDNSTYGLVIPARDKDEALLRAQLFAMTRQYKGEVMATVQVAPNWIGRLLEWWRGK